MLFSEYDKDDLLPQQDHIYIFPFLFFLNNEGHQPYPPLLNHFSLHAEH